LLIKFTVSKLVIVLNANIIIHPLTNRDQTQHE